MAHQQIEKKKKKKNGVTKSAYSLRHCEIINGEKEMKSTKAREITKKKRREIISHEEMKSDEELQIMKMKKKSIIYENNGERNNRNNEEINEIIAAENIEAGHENMAHHIIKIIEMAK